MTWVGLEYRYMPAAAELIRLVHAGAVGRPRMVAMREHRFPFLTKVGDWNRLTANTGGTLVEKTCHFFDLMNLIVGERPTRVMASGAQDVNHLDEVYDGRPADMLDNAFVIVDYPGGARALLDLCMFAEATHNQEEMSVVGPLGKVEALIPESTIRVGRRGEHWIGGVEEYRVDDPAIAHEGLHHGSSYLEHVHFLDAVRHGRPAEVTLEDGLWSVAMGVAAHRSIELGRPVAMTELLPEPSCPATRPDRTRRPTHEHRPADRPVEMSWFSALCDDDYEFLGQPDPAARQLVRALPQHRADRRPLRLRQRAAAVRLRPRHRQRGVRRGDGAA